MKVSDIVPSKDLLSLAQGVEADLVKRKRAGLISAIVALVWAVIQILLAAKTSYLGNIGTFFTNLVTGDWSKLFGPGSINYSEFVGILVLAAGFGTYFLLNWTSFLLKETEEPFRYSFWIEPFTLVGGPDKSSLTRVSEGQMSLLNRDLMERLNQRIQRLSLLDRKSMEPAASSVDGLKSHIQIGGDYAIREEKPGQWIIHVMARIRIGPPGKPETLAYPVRYPLKLKPVSAKDPPVSGPTDAIPTTECSVDVDSYKRIVERVYSRVATELYRQIEVDVQEKIDLFPTSYLRAVALYREAQDLAGSNTIDAYDHAISLYRQALRYFKVANVKPLTNLCLRLPVLWRFQTKFVHVQAMVQIGYAQSLIYRRNISAYVGRYRNPLFEISEELTEVIENLIRLHNKMNAKWPLVPSVDGEENSIQAQKFIKGNRLSTLMALITYPRDSWITPLSLKPSRDLFHRQTQILFDCYVVAALTHYNLGSIQRAKRYLGDAEAAGPGLSETNALYLLAAGEIEPDGEKAILLFRQATELGTNFEIAQYSLAKNLETLFRKQDEFLEERSRIVMKEYDEVLAINPGNIAALARQGYLLWLLRDFKGAKGKFEDGRENKAIVRQTFIGELNYGLARIAAEEGRFGASYDLYIQTIGAEPGVGAYSVTANRFGTTQYYDNIGPAMLARYVLFKETVEKKIAELTAASTGEKMRDEDKEEVSARVLNVVHSLVLNDYRNACLTYFLGVGDPSKLGDAIQAFERARDKDSESKIVPYNLNKAYLLRGKEEDKVPAQECLEKAERLGPTWPISVFALAQARLRHVQEKMMKTMGMAEQQSLAESQDRERNLASAAIEQTSAASPEVLHSATTSAGGDGWQPEDVRGRQSSVIETQQRLQDKSESAQSLYEKALKQLDELEKVLPEVQKIMGTTKLSSIYQGFNFDIAGNGVDRLLLAHIGRDRLDETDVQALRLWAEVLSNNFRSEQALQAAERICSYILANYYPESFDVISISRNMYLTKNRQRVLQSGLTTKSAERADHDQAIAESSRKIQSYTDLLKPIVKDRADRNPIEYAVLTSVQDVYKDEPLVAIEIFERGVKLAPENPRFWNLLGNMYYSRGSYNQSVDSFKKAIELDTTTVGYHINLGNTFVKLMQWEEAKTAYHKALELDPKNAGYWNSLGIMYYSSESYNQSIDSFKKAIELDPTTVLYHANLGNAFVNLKRWKKAKAAYRKALELDPKNAGYWNLLGIMYYSSESYDQSIESFRKAIELDPTTVVYHANLGVAFEKLKQWEEAKAAYYKALELDPKNASYWNSLGNIDYSSESYDRSIDSYKKAIEFDRNTAVYHANLGGAFVKLKQWEEAKAAYYKAMELDPKNAGYWNLLGIMYYSNESYDQSIDTFKKAIELDPTGVVYHANLGNAFVKLKQWEEAKAAYYKVLELDPKNAGHWNALGNIDYSSESYGQSIDSFKKAIELDPTTVLYHANLGNAFVKLMQWEEAKTAYHKALELDPKNAGYWNSLGIMYYSSESYNQSIDSFKKAIELDPTTVLYHANLGNAFVNLKRWKKAKAAYHKALELDPKNAGYWNLLGIMYYSSESYDQSIESFRKAIELDPTTVMYHAHLGDAFEKLKQWEEAKAAYYKALELDPKNAGYWNSLGNIDYSSESYDRSIDSYKKAIEFDRNTAVYHANLGGAFVKLKQWEEAKAAYYKALELDPKNAGYWNSLGNIDYSRESCDRSIDNYKKAIEIDPNTAVYHANLGGAFEKLKQWEEAKAAYHKALELEPNNAGYWNSLGIIYYLSESYDQSIDSFKKAIELDPTMAVYHAMLGGAFVNLKEWEEAKAAYHKTLELDPKNAGYWNSLGNMDYSRESYDESIDSYKKAIKFDPNTGVYHANLGGAFVKLKQWEEAKAAYHKALELEPNNASYWNSLGNIDYSRESYDQSIDSFKKAVELDPKVAAYQENLERAFAKSVARNDV